MQIESGRVNVEPLWAFLYIIGFWFITIWQLHDSAMFKLRREWQFGYFYTSYHEWSVWLIEIEWFWLLNWWFSPLSLLLLFFLVLFYQMFSRSSVVDVDSNSICFVLSLNILDNFNNLFHLFGDFNGYLLDDLLRDINRNLYFFDDFDGHCFDDLLGNKYLFFDFLRYLNVYLFYNLLDNLYRSDHLFDDFNWHFSGHLFDDLDGYLYLFDGLNMYLLYDFFNNFNWLFYFHNHFHFFDNWSIDIPDYLYGFLSLWGTWMLFTLLRCTFLCLLYHVQLFMVAIVK